MAQIHSHTHQWPGVPLALGAAILFAIATPFSKLLLDMVPPQMLAGELYLGAGIGLAAVNVLRNAIGIPPSEAPLRRRDLPRLAAVVLFGGVLGPLLLMFGLVTTDATLAALLLNLESLATMAIAWLVFRENMDRRLMLGAFAILSGGLALSWNGQGFAFSGGALLVAGACLAWGIDNNLTRTLSAADPVQVAMVKGIVAGMVNIAIALARGAPISPLILFMAIAVLGFVAVGLSLVLFVLALRHLGSARTGAYFSLAPFIGAAMAVILLREPVTAQLLAAGGLMGIGLWLHLAERHDHDHLHEPIEHEHAHDHDEHHRHRHDGPASEPHSHPHRHDTMRHKHPHYPDLHHRHPHG